MWYIYINKTSCEWSLSNELHCKSNFEPPEKGPVKFHPDKTRILEAMNVHPETKRHTLYFLVLFIYRKVERMRRLSRQYPWARISHVSYVECYYRDNFSERQFLRNTKTKM